MSVIRMDENTSLQVRLVGHGLTCLDRLTVEGGEIIDTEYAFLTLDGDQRAELIEALGASTDEFTRFVMAHASLIEQALATYAEYFEAGATQAEKDAEAPREEKEPKPGTIDITPTPAGFRHTAALFREQAAAARKFKAELTTRIENLPAD